MIATTKACIKPEFESTLCGCCQDCGSCCFTYFCCPCATATAWANVRDENCSCCHLCGITGVPLYTRANIRHARGMQLNYCLDCCTLYFCIWCATCQNLREIKLIKAESQIPDDSSNTTIVINSGGSYPQQNAYANPQQIEEVEKDDSS